ncbi:DHA1 family inner membrane transport protein [Pseudomonas hunanensis]|uniref:DHA1 family inner membrane transport protein n=1 Tax=Pseudomonas hunanensis TaxID=1247546 RepID=A0ACC6JY17_9PSED|nr:MFS transporter [Pseudomonas hunanensis]MDR6711104.1 DHA1 family inner membrane transport protein [Pseudomonas hunanensis]
MPLALWALAISAFGIGTTEFVIAGLLPQVAADFTISIPQAGNLATVYALGVFVGAPLLIILGTRIPRKGMLMLLMSLFVIGNFVTATASDFNIALLGRLVTSLTHGAFFGIGAVLAADLVAPNRRVQAISFMFSGLTVANLVGVPVGTWLSQVMSWRDTFYAITVVGGLGFIGVMMLIPKIPNHERPQIKKEFAAFANTRVLLAMGITVFGPAAFFTSITYIAPMMVEIAKFDPASVTWLMVVFGLGLFLGNILGGRYADKALMPLLYLTLGGQAIVLLIFSVTAHSQIMSAACILLMAGFGFATVSPIQKLVMDKARAAGAPTLASAVNIGLFNLGNAIGAGVGGFVIAAGLGYASPNWAGALLSLAALLLALASGALDRRDNASSSLQTA